MPEFGNYDQMKAEPDSIMDAVLEGMSRMALEGISAPADFIVNMDLWKILARPAPGGSLKELVEKQIGGHVIRSEAVAGAVLASARGGDLELVLGQDLSIGYHHHTSEEVFMFLTESFTFRVITPEAVVVYAL